MLLISSASSETASTAVVDVAANAPMCPELYFNDVQLIPRQGKAQQGHLEARGRAHNAYPAEFEPTSNENLTLCGTDWQPRDFIGRWLFLLYSS